MTEQQNKVIKQFQTQTRYANLLLDRMQQGEDVRMKLINTIRRVNRCVENVKKEFKV